MRIFSHPLFNPSNLQNDVAILRLSQSVNLGATPTIGVSISYEIYFFEVMKN